MGVVYSIGRGGRGRIRGSRVTWNASLNPENGTRVNCGVAEADIGRIKIFSLLFCFVTTFPVGALTNHTTTRGTRAASRSLLGGRAVRRDTPGPNKITAA